MTDGEPQPRPAVLTGNRDIGLREFLKKVSLLFGAYSNAGIANTQSNPILTSGAETVYLERNAAVIGKFAGIAQEVQQDLANLCNVTTHRADFFGHAQLKSIFVFSYGRC